MSADNGYILRKNAAGQFCLQEYSASVDNYPLLEECRMDMRFDTLERALYEYERIASTAIIEYGLTTQIYTILKTPEEWCVELGAKIMDPDGWRLNDGRKWSDPISREEFDRRFLMCTVDARGYMPDYVPRMSGQPTTRSKP